MSDERARAAAEAIRASWERGQRLRQLPDSCRPHSLQQGYAVQAMLKEVSGYPSVGWNTAATNVTGQRYIGAGDCVCAELRALGRVELTLGD